MTTKTQFLAWQGCGCALGGFRGIFQCFLSCHEADYLTGKPNTTMWFVLLHGESSLLWIEAFAIERPKCNWSDLRKITWRRVYIPVGIHIMPGFAEKVPDSQCIAHIQALRDQYFRRRKLTIRYVTITCKVTQVGSLSDRRKNKKAYNILRIPKPSQWGWAHNGTSARTCTHAPTPRDNAVTRASWL
jgi:hypothetical protein